MLKPLLIATLLVLAPSGPEKEKLVPKDTVELKQVSKTETVEEAKPAINLNAKDPPPTSWDKKSGTISKPPVDENTLAAQLVQTLLALVFVCLLIYLVGRFGLSRLTALRSGAATNTLSMSEKLSLDPKNALYIVEVKGQGKLLLGGSEQGLRLICSLDDEAVFGQAMSRSQITLVDSPPDAEVQEEHHG